MTAARKRSADSSIPRAPTPARPDLAQQLAAFQAALPSSRGEAYLRQRGIPLALAQQLGVGYTAPGSWPHADRDWRGGRVVFPHTTPAGRLVNLYGRAVGTEEQVPKAKRHDHLPGVKGYFNAAALQVDTGPLWVCEGVFDALALLAAGVPRVVAIFGVQGWRWDWGARSLHWSLPSMPTPLGSNRGGRSPGRRHSGGSGWRGCRWRRTGGARTQSEMWTTGVLGVRACGSSGSGWRRGTRRAEGAAQGLSQTGVLHVHKRRGAACESETSNGGLQNPGEAQENALQDHGTHTPGYGDRAPTPAAHTVV